MRLVLLIVCALAASASSAQPARLPQFSDYPAGAAYRGRVAPLVESSSPTARMYRTATRQAMAEGVNFAGHYVVAMWGCGTGCMSGHIVDARIGRAVTDLPFATPHVEYHPDSRLIAVNTPAEIYEMYGGDPESPIPSQYQSSYWVLEGSELRHLGSLLASDIQQIGRGGPVPPLRTATPGDVLVPIAVGTSWTYSSTAAGRTVTYRVLRQNRGPYSGFQVERTARGAGGTRQTVETWRPGYAPGDGSLNVQMDGETYRSYAYSFGVAEAGYDEGPPEHETVRVGAESREAVCYIQSDEATGLSRTCFVPRLGMTSRTEAGETLTLTAHTLR